MHRSSGGAASHANNGANLSTGGCGPWGGVCILEPTGATPGRFLNNTVMGNTLGAVVCNGSYPLLGSIIPEATTIAVCAYTPCCGAGPISVDSNYHLMAGSSCIDTLATNMSTMSTTYDIDGDPRPYGTLSDCGADEYTGP